MPTPHMSRSSAAPEPDIHDEAPCFTDRVDCFRVFWTGFLAVMAWLCGVLAAVLAYLHVVGLVLVLFILTALLIGTLRFIAKRE